MKNILITLYLGLCVSTGAVAQRSCGIEAEKAALIVQNPEWAARFEAQRSSLQGVADYYKKLQSTGEAARTTSVSAIPVIFHIIVTEVQLAQMGGTAGILSRISSQIDVLNEDFNKTNSDGASIPSGWVPLYASAGIHFGLAHTQPNGYGTPGYELIVAAPAFGGFNQGTYGSYSDAKHVSTGGIDAWDNTKYLNVWCTGFADNPGLLGITVAKSFTTGFGAEPSDEMGVCMNFLALGRRTSPADHYIPTSWSTDFYDQGRTLTHEMGHFFEIWHTWGDDGGLCSFSGGQDDGLADTPPEADHHFYNYPDTIPGGTYYDACKLNGTTNTQPYGIGSLDFMNYTDDVAMHLFTRDQAAAMAAMVLVPASSGSGATGSGTIGENYSLTQNPVLLTWPANAAVRQTSINNTLNISPNPTTGLINITFDPQNDALNGITVLNTLGQQVQSITATGNTKDYYSIDLSGMSKGIYFVRCNFASGTITRKILLQ